MCKYQIAHNASGQPTPSIPLSRDTLCKSASHLQAAEEGHEKDSMLFIPDNLLYIAGQYKTMYSIDKSQGLNLKLLTFEKKKKRKSKTLKTRCLYNHLQCTLQGAAECTTSHGSADITVTILQTKGISERTRVRHGVEPTVKHKEEIPAGDILKLLQIWKR